MEYDENKAIDYIKEHASLSIDYDDDEILNVIDIIYDYYEENGLLDIDCDDDDSEVDIDDVVEFASRMLRKDTHAKIVAADIRPIIEAEFEYETTLED